MHDKWLQVLCFETVHFHRLSNKTVTQTLRIRKITCRLICANYCVEWFLPRSQLPISRRRLKTLFKVSISPKKHIQSAVR